MNNNEISFLMPTFKSGETVIYDGKEETIKYIILKRQEIFVYLENQEYPVNSKYLKKLANKFVISRRQEYLTWY